MGNRGCEQFSNEKDDRPDRKSSSSNQKQDDKSGSLFSIRRKKSKKEEREDPFNMFNDMMNFGFGTSPDRMGFGLGEDLTRVMREASSSGNRNGAFSSQMFSSVTKIGEDGIPISESRGVSQSSNGSYKMAHQRRIGDRSQTRMRERQNVKAEFHESQKLHQITHNDLPRFTMEFKDRTKEWNSYPAVKDMQKPFLELEDGHESRKAVYPPSYTRQIPNHHGQSHNYNYNPRGIEY